MKKNEIANYKVLCEEVLIQVYKFGVIDFLRAIGIAHNKYYSGFKLLFDQ